MRGRVELFPLGVRPGQWVGMGGWGKLVFLSCGDGIFGEPVAIYEVRNMSFIVSCPEKFWVGWDIYK